MKSAELALRKELALTRLRIARAELALADAQKPGSLATASSAFDLAALLLAHDGLGRWSRYVRLGLTFARALLRLRRLIPVVPQVALSARPRLRPRPWRTASAHRGAHHAE